MEGGDGGMSGNLGYLIGQGIKGIFRNRTVNIAALCVLIACLMITGSFVLAVLDLQNMVNEAGNQNEISVFIDETLSDSETTAIGNTLSALPNVKEVRFVSRIEGLQSLKEQFGSLLDGLEDDNPLRDAYYLTLEDLELLPQTADEVGSIPGVAKVNYREDVAATLVRIRNTVALLGIVFVTALAIVSMVIISNAIRISAFSRRMEISVMKIVGATNHFIRTSFIIEGVLVGLAGALFAYAGQWLLYDKLVYPRISELNFIQVLPFSQVALPMLVAFCVAGFLMSAIGSALAIRRYLSF
jgi:cell division transport system permease protein